MKCKLTQHSESPRVAQQHAQRAGHNQLHETHAEQGAGHHLRAQRARYECLQMTHTIKNEQT